MNPLVIYGVVSMFIILRVLSQHPDKALADLRRIRIWFSQIWAMRG